MRATERVMSTLVRWVPAALILGGLEVMARVGDVSPVILPAPSKVVMTLGLLGTEGPFLFDIYATLVRLGQGLGISLIFAVPLGISMGASGWVDAAAGTTVDFLRSLPATALIPGFIMVFGVGEANKVAMVTFVVGLILTIQLREGIRSVPRAPVEVAKIFGLSKTARLGVMARLALPAFLSGVQVSVNLALVMVVVVEMFVGGGARSGIGRRIYESQASLRIDEMWASILAVGIVGYLLAVGTRKLSRRLAPWSEELGSEGV